MPGRHQALIPIFLTIFLYMLVAAHAGSDPLAAPDAPGPWAVGYLKLTATDQDRDRTLPVHVWYPVDAVHASSPAAQYTFDFAPGITLTSELALDAPQVSAARRWPLIIQSHGLNVWATTTFVANEALASHGFIVVAADHVGDRLIDYLMGTARPLDELLFTRPLDISFLISDMLARGNTPGDPFFDRIDPDRIGGTGYSLGGYAVLAAASGLDAGVPADPRIRAVLPVTGAAARYLSAAELGRIQIPALFIAGTHDQIFFDADQGLPLMTGSPWRSLVVVHRAGHPSFARVCRLIEHFIAAGADPNLIAFIQSGFGVVTCTPDRIDNEEAVRLTSLYSVAFFKTFLEEDLRYRRYLTPGYARLNEPSADLHLDPTTPQVSEIQLTDIPCPLSIDLESLPTGAVAADDPAFTDLGLDSIEVRGSQPTDAYDVGIDGCGLASIDGQLTVVAPGAAIDESFDLEYTITWSQQTRQLGLSITDNESLAGADGTQVPAPITLNFFLRGALVATHIIERTPSSTPVFLRSNLFPFDQVTIDAIYPYPPAGFGLDNITVSSRRPRCLRR